MPRYIIYYNVTKEIIRKQYWKYIPYEYRPSQIYRKIRGYIYDRYKITNPRYLPYTWVDKDEILLHTMFEILSKFVEKECSKDCRINWTVTDEHKKIYDEILYLYNWFHKEYIPYYKDSYKEWDKLPDVVSYFKPIEGSTLYEYDPVFKSEEDKVKYYEMIKEIKETERKFDEQKIEMMKRLVDASPYLWT